MISISESLAAELKRLLEELVVASEIQGKWVTKGFAEDALDELAKAC